MYVRRRLQPLTAGFTLLEFIVVMAIIGILAAIVAPSWATFMNKQRVDAAENQALQAMREAQFKAKQEKQTWEASFRQEGEGEPVQWSVHRLGEDPAWNNLTESNADTITIYESYTNLNNDQCEAGDYCVQFQDRGVVDEDWRDAQNQWGRELGRITFTSVNTGDNGPKRCAVVSTILGSIRSDSDDECQ
jgi:prepilin-type N-terminal cleavage/methylation domain-containing protein